VAGSASGNGAGDRAGDVIDPSPGEQPWRRQVLQRFEQAAPHYVDHAGLQQAVAWRLAGLCRRRPLPRGRWLDLGAGTGILADALETLHPGQSVGRLDGSEAMLARQRHRHDTRTWDLQQGLPPWPERPQVLASSFCLHWLVDPHLHMQQWYEALAPSGWLALALPVHGSFRQWHQAASTSGQPCTALPLPTATGLLEAVPAQAVRHHSLHRFTTQARSVAALLRPMRRVGAGSTPVEPLGVRAWRELGRHWPAPETDGRVRLTWMIQILLLQR
jgi:malonyl-CoA O-methyltransferase